MKRKNRLFKKLSKQCELKSFSYFFEYEQYKRFFSKKEIKERNERFSKFFEEIQNKKIKYENRSTENPW